MISNFKPRSLLALSKKLLLGVLVLWALTATVLLIRLQPKPLLIGIDYGARVISDSTDRLLKIERENFLKKYLSLAYNYSSADYEKRVSQAGDLMSKSLWESKKADFGRIAQGLKTQELLQKTEIKDLREVESELYEVDLQISVKNKLKETTVPIRVELKIRKKARTAENPFEFEVERYEEQTLS